VVGADRASLDLKVADLLVNNLVHLAAFIQYPDGSTSRSSLNPVIHLRDVRFEFSGLDHQLIHSADCASDGGTFDGSNVLLPSSCGIAFSTNTVSGLYTGPQLGFSLDPNYNGSFTVLFVWDELVAGTDLEAEGYETFLIVNIAGLLRV
jgi:hypothetical protein